MIALLVAAATVPTAARGPKGDSCPHAPRSRPSAEQFRNILDQHETWLKEGGLENPGISGRAVLCNMDLRNLDLRKRKLNGADLRGVDFSHANLTEARLANAKLERAKLDGADLKGADLTAADLTDASLVDTDRRYAFLYNANLTRAVMIRTALDQSKANGADLTEARYEASAAPSKGHLSGLKGLDTVRFAEDQESGLALLRSTLRDVGLRSLERRATFAIESRRTGFLLGMKTSEKEEKDGIKRLSDHWDPWWERVSRKPMDFFLGILRRWLVEETTGYGLFPFRALYIYLPGLWAIAALIYTVAIRCPRARGSGIYRIFPPGRIVSAGPRAYIGEDQPVEWLHGRSFWRSLGGGFWFSTLAAFHFGWRDLNIGAWLARMQRREYALRALGWVRTVAGLQSIASLYLIVIWALTYFGRPFQ